MSLLSLDWETSECGGVNIKATLVGITSDKATCFQLQYEQVSWQMTAIVIVVNKLG